MDRLKHTRIIAVENLGHYIDQGLKNGFVEQQSRSGNFALFASLPLNKAISAV